MIDIVIAEKDFFCSCGNRMDLHFDKIVHWETIRYRGDKGYPFEIPMYGKWMIYFSCNPGKNTRLQAPCPHFRISDLHLEISEIDIFHQRDGFPECHSGLIYFDSITKNADDSITAEFKCGLCKEKIKVTFPNELLPGVEFRMVRR